MTQAVGPLKVPVTSPEKAVPPRWERMLNGAQPLYCDRDFL